MYHFNQADIILSFSRYLKNSLENPKLMQMKQHKKTSKLNVNYLQFACKTSIIPFLT